MRPTAPTRKTCSSRERRPFASSCHDGAKEAFKKAHGGYPVGKALCAGCHDPHSSQEEKLLKSSVHDPVTGGQCDSCHRPAGSEKPFETIEEGQQALRQLP